MFKESSQRGRGAQARTYKERLEGFPGGAVVENLPANAGYTGSIPGQGTRIPHATGQLSPRATITAPQLE